MRVLVIEDYLPTLESIRKELKAEGLQVDYSTDGEEGLWYAQTHKYDVILLDLMLPNRDGWSILNELRSRGLHTHVIVLTARDNVEDRVRGLDLGADDYLVKPFAMEELKARIRAVSRRNLGQKDPVIELPNGLRVDTSRKMVSLLEKRIELTPREYALLYFFLCNRDTVVSRMEIWDGVYEFHSKAQSNVVDVYVARLRRKLDIPGRSPMIKTSRGFGYILVSNAE